MATTREILNNITKVEGIVAAMLVGRDGFIIESVGDSKIDVEAVGALVTTAIGTYEVLGKELEIGKTTQVMAEFERSMVMAVVIGTDAILAIVTGAGVNLGNIRYTVKRYSRELETST